MAQRLVDGPVDLVTFELLEQIARTGSVSGAAVALGVSQQAASSRLRGAERSLGLRLVHRTAAGSELTEHGGMVLEWGAPVLDAARRAAVALEALRNGEAPLTVAASQTVAEVLLPAWLDGLRRQRPDARFRLLSGNSEDVAALVIGGTAQLGFVEGPTPSAPVHAAVVAPDELVVVVSPEHSWAGREVGLDELVGTSLVLRERGSGTRAVLETWAARLDRVIAAPAAELRTASAIRAAVRSLAAPAVLSREVVADDVAAGRLVRVTVAAPPIVRDLTAIWTAPVLAPLAEALLHVARSHRRSVRS